VRSGFGTPVGFPETPSGRGIGPLKPGNLLLFSSKLRFVFPLRRAAGTQLTPERKADSPPRQRIGFCLLSENSTDQRPEAAPFPKLICS
jgi:hypothetical protein